MCRRGPGGGAAGEERLVCLCAFCRASGGDRVVSIDLKKITIGQLPGAISNKQLIGRIFHGTKYKVVYEPNMEDYLLCQRPL